MPKLHEKESMKNQFELEIGPDGTIKTIYQDGIEEFAQELGAEVSSVCRASHVEFEQAWKRRGWSVRSAKDPNFALREVDDGNARWLPTAFGRIKLFHTREEALEEEVKFFWELLNAKEAK